MNSAQEFISAISAVAEARAKPLSTMKPRQAYRIALGEVGIHACNEITRGNIDWQFLGSLAYAGWTVQPAWPVNDHDDRPVPLAPVLREFDRQSCGWTGLPNTQIAMLARIAMLAVVGLAPGPASDKSFHDFAILTGLAFNGFRISQQDAR